jgi:hypothetical protein
MSQLESRLASDMHSSISSICAKASSSWIASSSQFLDNPRNAAFNCGVWAVTANSAQRAACLRHSFGSPTITYNIALRGRSVTVAPRLCRPVWASQSWGRPINSWRGNLFQFRCDSLPASLFSSSLLVDIKAARWQRDLTCEGRPDA